MDSTTMLILFLFFIIWMTNEEKKKKIVIKKIATKDKNGNKVNQEMLELVKSFIGKNAYIHTIDTNYAGVITQVTQSGVLLDNGKALVAINLDYIISVAERPRKKNKN